MLPLTSVRNVVQNHHFGWILWLAILVAVTGQALIGKATVADEFKVENAVYVSTQEKAVSQSTTIFHGGAVYDFLTEPAEVAIFEKTGNRFILVDVARRTRTELSTENVTTFTQRLQQRAAKSADPLVKFLAEPKFEEQYDAARGELTLGSPLVSYRLVLAAEANQEAVEQYREFSDWYARLNTLLVPGSRPPFGRLAANAALAKRQAMASQVFLTISPPQLSPGKPATTIRSEHRLVRPLAPADLQRVARLRAVLTDLKLVSFEQYRKAQPR
jgi:hypothetical protein